MNSEPVSPATTTGAHGIDLYGVLGGMDACRRLSKAFYARVEHDPILRPLYPPTLKGCPIEALADFFVQFLGGPCVYTQRRWYLSLREAHLRFKIGQQERDAWLNNMFGALDDLNIEEPARSALRWYFEQASAYLVNRPLASANESPFSSKLPIEDQHEPSTNHILQDIAQRWNVQHTLEETVAAIRKSDADSALTLIESSLLQTYFKRDRAAFLSLLAIMSGSNHPVLLRYVRQELVSRPELVRERYPYDRTLLHEVAGKGSLAIVELLLHLGANPNTVDQSERTPLYFVGNECNEESGGNIVRALVQSGANVDAQDRLKHCTALHMAARRGNVRVAEALLDCGADIEARDKLGDTPLRRAVNCGKTDMVAFLLSRGADIHSKGKNGLTPYQVARGAAMKEILSPSQQ